MKNRRGDSHPGFVLVDFILVAVVIVVLLVAVYIVYPWINDIFRNLPDFEETEYGKKVIAEQEAVPEVEKARGFTSTGEKAKYYPLVRIYYSEGVDDFFVFRWNPNLNFGKGRVQVLTNVRNRNLFLIPQSHESAQWLVNPDIEPLFRDQKGMYGYEKLDVMEIMNAKTEDEMIAKIAKASERENAAVDFPIENWELVEGDARGRKEKISKEELKHELMEYDPEFYKEEVQEEIKKGAEFISDSLEIYFDDWGYDDVAVARWNFKSQKAELALRPDKDKILANEQEVWVDSEEAMNKLLQANNKFKDIEPANRQSLGELLNMNKPSELSKKIEGILGKPGTYTTYGKGWQKATNEDLSLIDINGRMYGYDKNPDELFKIEDEAENVE